MVAQKEAQTTTDNSTSMEEQLAMGVHSGQLNTSSNNRFNSSLVSGNGVLKNVGSGGKDIDVKLVNVGINQM